jgi:hypothetical protein
MSKRRQSSRATCPKPATTPFRRTPTTSRSLGDGLRAEEQGRRRRSGEVRRTALSLLPFRQARFCATAMRSWASPSRHRSAELDGKRAGDAISFIARELVIEERSPNSCDTKGRKLSLAKLGAVANRCDVRRNEVDDAWRGPGDLGQSYTEASSPRALTFTPPGMAVDTQPSTRFYGAERVEWKR